MVNAFQAVTDRRGCCVVQISAIRSLYACEKTDGPCSDCQLVDNFRPVMPLNGRSIVASFRKCVARSMYSSDHDECEFIIVSFRPYLFADMHIHDSVICICSKSAFFANNSGRP